ncbi:MAG TPA: PH domain-containing protein [Bryobacteraceae bacterium]|jgi:uncharacterized membrane protein YdbT with pleckstrin-like domain|nr:PH domain-containing protein [Bryobacteraceae bacterium]
MPIEGVTIRPSMKTVWLVYGLVIVIIAACFWVYFEYADDKPRWLLVIPFAALLTPLNMHLRRRTITLRFQDDHLILETGFLSRTRRTVDTAKIQDVTVKQTLGQRLMGVGDLMLESAGESGGMAIANLDRPREIADAIINSSKRAPDIRSRGGLR